MTTSQGRATSELSSSLVRDYRAIITSLEQSRAAGTAPLPAPADLPTPEVPSVEGTLSEPIIRPARSAASNARGEARPAPLGFAELRSRLSALSEVKDIIPSRRPAEEAGTPDAPVETVAAPAAPVPAVEPGAGARRRAFGGAARQDNETPTVRRRRSSSKDAFTWQRLGVLALCMAAAGGAAVALQSVVGRDEARVAPEVIGNAAIASVAPSAPAQVAVVAPVVPEPVAPAASSGATPSVPAPTLRSSQIAEAPRPAASPLSAQALLSPPAAPMEVVPGLTAFAAPDAPAVAPAPVATSPAATASAAVETEVKLPLQAPLPPPAPTRPVAAVTPAAAPVSQARAAAPQAAAPAVAEPASEVADEADETGNAKFGGDPVGSATIRSAVTMRSAPKNGASTVLTLKSGQHVELVACERWCEIIADGKRGFIYKRFVDASAPKEGASKDAAGEAATAAQ